MSETARPRSGPTASAVPGREYLGFSTSFMDPAIDPRVDFFEYATGGWRRAHPIPADKPDWNAFGELRQRTADLLHELVEEVLRAPGPSRAARLVADFYASALDTATRDRLGFDPVRADLARIDAARSLEELVGEAGRLHLDGFSGLFDTWSAPDDRRSEVYALTLWQGGLGLPDREYYRAAAFADAKRSYEELIARMLRLAGRSETDARSESGRVVALESELAECSLPRAETRDVVANYHRVETRDLPARFPQIPWAPYFAARGLAGLDYIVVGQPAFLDGLGALLAGRPLEDWRAYLRWHVVLSAAPYLSQESERAHFDFFRRVLSGQPEIEPAWKRAVDVIDGRIGEALGELFVARHFPPESRRQMEELIADLRAVFTERLKALPWMGAATREKALAKFARFEAFVGHPTTFRDYAGLTIAADDFFGNVRRADAFEVRRGQNRLGAPVDRTEWRMSAPTVNAHFVPTMNEIFFPAGILQPPFFDPAIDPAVNYGGIGAVIGHEITHGYDDQGRRYDVNGNLNDWWSAEDAAEFEQRAREVVRQYSAIEPLPGVRVNGELTLGENIADLGGISVAFEALQRRLRREPALRRSIDGLTPEQRFFIAWAQVWRQNSREEEVRRRITIDPHSPGLARGSVPPRNMAEFWAAFPARGGNGAAPDAPRRVTIW
ncbi:MAG TPA: M13 family metallopeptidase [Thermoplasmata archaeon]|nr:M13 family metallopeptidase [Thermoplasmata archaeon]